MIFTTDSYPMSLWLQEAQEAREKVSDLQQIAAARNEYIENKMKEFEHVKTKLAAIKAQHEQEINEFCEEIKKSAAAAICQARIKMAKEAKDQNFAKNSWNIEGWCRRYKQIMGKKIQDSEQDMGKEVQDS